MHWVQWNHLINNLARPLDLSRIDPMSQLESKLADQSQSRERPFSVTGQILMDGGCPDSPRFLNFDVTIVPARYTTLIVKHAGLVPIR